MTDLASAIAAAVAAVTIQHEDWCCAKGCTQPHYELTPPVDDGSDSPFMAPGIRKLGHCAGTEDDCSCWRRIALQHVREGVEAAAPLIEAAVREQAEAAMVASFERWDSLGPTRAPHPEGTYGWLVERAYAECRRIARGER